MNVHINYFMSLLFMKISWILVDEMEWNIHDWLKDFLIIYFPQILMNSFMRMSWILFMNHEIFLNIHEQFHEHIMNQ